MPLETGSYISDLDANNPSPTDVASQGDDHIRLVKSVLKNTFPNLNGAVSATDEDLSAVASGAIQVASVNLGKAATPDTGSGFASAGAGKVAATGRWTGKGFIPPGMLCKFPKEPSSLGKSGNNTGGPFDYLELDGSLWNVADYPELGAFLGSTYGGDGTTTFGVPNEKDTGRYERSRTAVTPVGTYQASEFKTHSHTGSTSLTGGHTHIATVSDPEHTHDVGSTSTNFTGGTNGPEVALTTGAGHRTGASATGITVGIASAGDHSHTVTIPSGTDSGSTETRPESLVVVSCIKT